MKRISLKAFQNNAAASWSAAVPAAMASRLGTAAQTAALQDLAATRRLLACFLAGLFSVAPGQAETLPRLQYNHPSPTVVRWGAEGPGDLLIGAEDGYFYLMQNPNR